jgi:hypothetical protein
MTPAERTAHYIARSLDMLGFSPEAIKDMPPDVALNHIAASIESMQSRLAHLQIASADQQRALAKYWSTHHPNKD